MAKSWLNRMYVTIKESARLYHENESVQKKN